MITDDEKFRAVLIALSGEVITNKCYDGTDRILNGCNETSNRILRCPCGCKSRVVPCKRHLQVYKIAGWIEVEL